MAKMTIKANRDYITIMLDKILSGEYAIPEFQRDFVWSSKQIVELFDSIIKGYPIGTLILWKPESESFRTLHEIGGISVTQKQQEYEKMYILDGRQRITALISVLYPGGEYYNKIYIDLEEMQIIQAPANRHTGKVNMLKLGMAYDTYELVDFLEKLKASPLNDTQKKIYAERAKKINKTLLSYELGYISVTGGNINEAVEVFSRLNSKSTPISADYMLQALAYDPNTGFLFANEISTILQNLWKYNFNKMKRELILNCAYTYAEIPFIDGKVEDLLKKKNNLKEVMENVAKDVSQAVEFLYKECGVIDYRLLPYSYQLIMLASFFRWNRQPNPQQIKELKQWFFYTTYSAYFTNSSLSVIREDIKRFTNYAKTIEKTPIAYNRDNMDFKLPDSLNLGGVRACAFVITTILQHNMHKSDAALEIITIPHSGGKCPGNSFICTSKKDIAEISNWLNKRHEWSDKLAKFGLTASLAHCFKQNTAETFIKERSQYILQQEKTFIKDMLSDVL